MSCNLGKTRTRFTVNSLVFVILFWFLVENFKLSARTKDVRDTRDAFLESVYPCIERESNGILTGMHMNKMYTLGTHVEVVTDHAPLLPAYNAPNKPKQLRVDRHRTKLLPIRYNVVYEPGKMTPCDYGSHHPPPNTTFTEEQRVDWAIEDETDIFVNQVIQDQLPQSITLGILRAATATDPELQLLKENIITNKLCRNHLISFQEGIP